MTEPLTLRSASMPATTSYQRTSILPFYSGMAAIAGLVFLLVLVYHCILARQGSEDHQPGAYRSSGQFHQHPNRGLHKSIWVLIPASKYQKQETQTQVWEEQCTVCLSVFADGEVIRQLPGCKHSFHKDCIDMWFYSHSNCPLCRASLEGLQGEENSAGMV